VMAALAGVAVAAPNDPADTTPQQVFDDMAKSFHAEKAAGIHVRYQFELSGPEGGQWWITVNDGAFKMGKGRVEQPDVTFIASDKDWVALSNDKLSGTWAFLTGRLKIHGNRDLARKLNEIF
jgi:putative sterol carrier protein